jgi:neutral ceramidase
MRTLLILFAGPLLSAAGLNVGTASVSITPPTGAPMAGYYYNRAAEGMHDELYAKAIVIESGGAKTALVTCDLVGLPREVVERARARAQDLTGIPGANIMISATHAHTGPVILSAAQRYNLTGQMLEIATAYTAGLPGQIARAIEMANQAIVPARLRAAQGNEPSLTFNRRFLMKDGSTGWNPGKLNPNIVRPAGPIDPQVRILSFESLPDKPLALYVNYALHLDTVGGMRYSADYPYTLSKALAAAIAPGLLTEFTIGCAGNLNHIDVSSSQPQRGNEEAARIGTVLAASVLKALRNTETPGEGQLRVASVNVPLALAAHKAEELRWAHETASKFGEQNAAPFLDLVRATRIEEVDSFHGKPLVAEVQVIALGPDVAIVGLPGEIFTELGMAIKLGSPFRNTIVTELAIGSPGYIPDRKAFAQGNYEAVSSRVAPGSGEKLVEEAVNLLLKLHTD